MESQIRDYNRPSQITKRATFPLHDWTPIGELLTWFEILGEAGFTRKAMVKVGKTTGQKRIVIVEEGLPEREDSEPAAEVS